MELQQLRYFQSVATTENLTRSAMQLHVSQPVLSVAISRLESELGVQLFDRVGRSIKLNRYGKFFLDRVNRILMEVENAKNDLLEIHSQEQRTIRFAVTTPQFLNEIMTLFIESHPGVTWQQSVEEPFDIAKMLNSDLIDFGICSPGITDNNIESIILHQEEYQVAFHKNHHFQKLKKVSLKDIAAEKFIALQKKYPLRAQIDQIFYDCGLKPNIIMECDFVVRSEMLNANAGVTITTLSAIKRKLFSSDICFLPISDCNKRHTIVLVKQKGKQLPPTSQKFCDFLQNYYRGFAEKASY